jgi:hypothetical protein
MTPTTGKKLVAPFSIGVDATRGHEVCPRVVVLRLVGMAIAICACRGGSLPANGSQRPIRARPTFPNPGGGPVLVVGHIKDPGMVPWFRGMGVGFAILARGGVLPSFDPKIEIHRRELGKERTAFANYHSEYEPEFELAPGDVVVVNAIIDNEPIDEAEVEDFREAVR